MASIAYHHSRTTGEDALDLAVGLAATRVVNSQMRLLQECRGVSIDSKYGHPATAIGVTASIIAVFRTIVTSESAAWIIKNEVVQKSIARALQLTAEWATMILIGTGIAMQATNPGKNQDPRLPTTLNAERRALYRASAGVEAAFKRIKTAPRGPFETLQLVLDYATAAAFPPRCCQESTQAAVVAEITDTPTAFFGSIGRQAKQDAEALLRMPHNGYIPLANLPLSLPAGVRSESDSSSSRGSPESVISSVSSWEL